MSSLIPTNSSIILLETFFYKSFNLTYKLINFWCADLVASLRRPHSHSITLMASILSVSMSSLAIIWWINFVPCFLNFKFQIPLFILPKSTSFEKLSLFAAAVSLKNQRAWKIESFERLRTSARDKLRKWCHLSVFWLVDRKAVNQ